MAGIGFELKKLFKKKSLTANLTGVVFSVFTTVGHIVIIILVLLAIRYFLLGQGLSRTDEQLYAAIVLYSFIFPLIFSSGLCIIISRYIADMMWQKRDRDIMASVYGVLATYCLIASPIAIVFLFFAKLSLALSVFAYLLFMLVGIVFILMVYVSALKDYVQIAVSFILGMAVTFIGSYLVIRFAANKVDIVTILIGFFALGMLIACTGVFLGIKKYFTRSSRNYFGFLTYIKKYPFLYVGNTLYTIGMYAQNFVFWANPDTRDSVSIFIFSNDFDFATYLGVMTIIPAVVMFVVRMETTFYEYYREYMSSINVKTGREIFTAKNLMKRKMWQEFFYVAELQILFSLICVVLGLVLFPQLSVSTNIVEMYPTLACGYVFTYFMFLASTLLQYFENYRDSLKVMLVFVILNPIFNVLTVFLGADFYGTGMIFAAAAGLTASLIYLKRTLDNVDYLIFCTKNIGTEETVTFTDKLVRVLNGKQPLMEEASEDKN